ncbi:MAG: type II toxin-antitoxin system VapC family toxin [Chlorobiaceae bacterium]|nr:type II toxin-antitoxin system VapC family toxin [Chlorobiaceae bacterium]
MGTIADLLDNLHGQQVYLDTNVFIYFLDRNPDYFEIVAPLIEAIESGAIAGCTGDAVIAETLVKPYQTGNLALVASIKVFFRSENFLSVYPHDAETFDLAAQLKAKYNQKFIDALHYATAIKAGCKAIITNDSGIRDSEEMEVILLSKLLKQP